MESSRALSRCLQQLQRWPRSNPHKTTVFPSKRITQCPRSKTSQSTSRPLSTTSRRHEDEQPKPSPPSQSATQDTPRPQRPAPLFKAEPNKTRIETNRSDKSSISSSSSAAGSQNPQSRRAAMGASALASIDALISQTRARVARNNANANASTQQQSQQQKPQPARTVYNEDLYGRGGSVAQRSSEISSAPSSSFSYPNMHGLLGDLNTSSGLGGLSSLHGEPKPPEIFLRLKPTLGKTAALDEERGVGLTRAFLMLENKINKGGNSVKRDLVMQKFHVRRGQARKIHRRMRWRELFKEGFLGECARVRRMIKQGW